MRTLRGVFAVVLLFFFVTAPAFVTAPVLVVAPAFVIPLSPTTTLPALTVPEVLILMVFLLWLLSGAVAYSSSQECFDFRRALYVAW